MKLISKFFVPVIILSIFFIQTNANAESMDIDAFKAEVRKYTRNVLKGEKDDYSNEKKAILNDMLSTKHIESFDLKYDVLLIIVNNAINDASRKTRAKNVSKKDKQLYQQRKNELFDLNSKVRLAREDFYKKQIQGINRDPDKDPTYDSNDNNYNNSSDSDDIASALEGEPVSKVQSSGHPWNSKLFGDKVIQFTENLLKNKPMNVVEEKKSILWDLLTTRHIETFQVKLGHIMYYKVMPLMQLTNQTFESKNFEEFKKNVARKMELEDLVEKAKLAREDFAKAYIKELIHGKAPSASMKFRVKKMKYKPAPETSDVTKFKQELEKANKILSAALTAAKNNQKEKFATYWVEEKQKIFRQEQKGIKIDKLGVTYDITRGFNKATNTKEKLAVMPYYMRDDLADAAIKFVDKGWLVAGLIKWKKMNIVPDYVTFIKENGTYKIFDW